MHARNVTAHHINVDDPTLLATLKYDWKSTYNSPAGSTINDDDPTLLTTQKIAPPPVLKKKIGSLVTNLGGLINHCRPNPLGDPKVEKEKSQPVSVPDLPIGNQLATHRQTGWYHQ